ncbi:unnamed protein product [Rotaria sp. Silwood2]|nr:unnamed protein product [Rotaria sp. Silwood2]CAF3445107.1 unnamed protein product [Rotaria sp. Silwood2]CAF4691604.1 unnamed protein product [Rotaria sp. Silwood2]
MLARCCLFSLSHYFYYRLILSLLSSFFLLFNCISNPFSSHQFFILSNIDNLSIQYPFINTTLSKTDFPFTHHKINTKTNRTIFLVITSAIYNDDYIQGIKVLGYTLRRIDIQADLILFYISNRLKQSIFNRCQKVG